MRGRHLGGGWRVIDGCRLVAGGTPFEIVLAHRELGLALMELEPRWTPGAEQLLQQRLAAAGFARRFPGHIPIIHRRLRREDLPELPIVLTEAFSWQDPLTVAADSDWIEGLREALGGDDLEAPTRAPGPAVAAVGSPSGEPDGATPRGGPVVEPAAVPVAPAAPLAALAAVLAKPDVTPAPANAPSGPAAVSRSGTSRGRRIGMAVGGAAIAAGVALVVVLGQPRTPESSAPAAEPPRVQLAATAGPAAPALAQSAGAAPAPAPGESRAEPAPRASGQARAPGRRPGLVDCAGAGGRPRGGCGSGGPCGRGAAGAGRAVCGA
ncbi:hypothetical protein [Elioraea sp.]|uniref:hypothetical protein n=1 Tax=Elioraea sp. TaxID=2185103 RepID=UPI003F72979D